MGPMLSPWTLLSGALFRVLEIKKPIQLGSHWSIECLMQLTLCKYLGPLWPDGHLFVYHTIPFILLARHFWRLWTYKMSVLLFCRVCLSGEVDSVSFNLYNISMELYIFPLPSNQKMNHCPPLLRGRSWNNGICCVFYYIVMRNCYQFQTL